MSDDATPPAAAATAESSSAATNNNDTGGAGSRSVLDTVKTIRDALNKELPLDDDADDAKVETCKDLLARLSECTMTLDILADTMIGKVVSSLKKHATLGTTAKALIKQWKKVAKANEEETTTTPSKPAAIQRKSTSTASSSAVDASLKEIEAAAELEWQGLSSMRQTICKKFLELLLGARKSLIQEYGINEQAANQLLAPRAAEVEGALWTSLGQNDTKAYAAKARSLVFNLRKNQSLTHQVILGQVASDQLVTLSSEDLASAETRQARDKEAKKLIDSKRLDWEQANEAKINEMCGIKGDLLAASLFTCGRCKSTKTTSTQKQTRSADEPMTVFVFCLNCGKRWKC